MTSLEVILAAADSIRSRAIGYLLRTADDREVPRVVAHEWPGGRRSFEYHRTCRAPSPLPTEHLFIFLDDRRVSRRRPVLTPASWCLPTSRRVLAAMEKAQAAR